MSPFLIGLLLLVAGLAGVFFGYRIFRIILPIFGGIAGYLIAASLFPNSLFLALVIGFILAVVLAIVAYAAWSIMVTISGAILGGSVGAAIANGLNFGPLLLWILAIGLAIVGAILVWKIRDEVVIILTAIAGAGFVASGLRLMFGAGTIRELLWAMIFIVLAVIGIVWQWRRYRHLRLLAFGGPAAAPAPAQTAPAVATRAAPVVPIEAAPVAGVAAATAVAGATVAVAATADAEPPVAEAAAPIIEGAAPVVETVPAAAAAAGVALAATAAETEPAVAETAAPAVEAGAAVAADTKVGAAAPARFEAALAGADLGNLQEKIDYIEGVGAAYAAKLNAAGIVTVMDLLSRGATRKGRADLAEATGIVSALILRWVNHADLFRVKGVGKQFGELLEAAGIDTVVELGQRNPANLFNRLTEVNAEKKLAGRSPRQDEVNNWVAQAKSLPRVVEY